MAEHITVERRGHILLVGINRPEKRNAFTVEMFADIGRAYGELERDDELRCAVLHAHGAHFTGGLDLAAWTPVFAGGSFPKPDGAIDPLGLDGDPVSKPVVCAVQGICFTIGIELIRQASRWTSARRSSRRTSSGAAAE
jgi:enoyl-CoA hydratase/carnithine racemase